MRKVQQWIYTEIITTLEAVIRAYAKAQLRICRMRTGARMTLSSLQTENDPPTPVGKALEQALDRIVLNAFRSVLTGLVGLYLIFSLSHMLVLPAAIAHPMALLALSSSAACLALRWTLTRQLVAARYAHLFGAGVTGIMLVNIVVHLYWSGDPLQTTNFLLLMIGIACLFLSPVWFAVVEGTIVGAWGLVVWSLPPTPAWLHFAFAFLTTLFLATTVFLVRRRNFRRLEEFRLRDDAQKKELATALHAAEESNVALGQSNSQLAEARDAADAANRAKSEFLANMSHEIRTPLNAVIGMADIVLEDELTPIQRENVQMIQTSGTHLLDILQNILDFAKIEADRLELEKIPFAVRQSMDTVRQIFQIAASEKGIGLRYLVADEVPENILGDPVRLRQVLLNLVGNALKFTNAGEVSIAVTCRELTQQRARLHYAVRDTGIGLPADKLEHIFAAFAQADSSMTRQFGGTGLGLSISARLVEAMGGRIWVESEEGAGSTFQFEIEFDLAAAAKVAVAAEVEETALPLRILLAEDNLFNQKVAVHMLENQGHSVRVVADGVQALAALEQEHFDVLLVDIQMPEMDGFEVAEQIRANETGSDNRQTIIALTAHASAGDRQRCLQAGMDDYLTKPLRKIALVAALKRAAMATDD